MSTIQRKEVTFTAINQSSDWVDHYWQQGYVIIRRVFSAPEIANMAERFDHWYQVGLQHTGTWRHGNRIIWKQSDAHKGDIVRGMQWPSYDDPYLASVRTDARLAAILKPLIGDNLKQIINQMHWKTPGARVVWGLHRDRRSRTPASAFRDLARSYVQMGIAVDRHWADNGAMKILPGSQNLPEHRRDQGSADYTDEGIAAWQHSGVDTDALVDVCMEPGDIALWGPDTVHGGGINTTEDNERRLYINGYVIADNCDRGEWAWRNGTPCTLNPVQPALIQYNELHTRPEPHYPDAGAANAQPHD